jgi:hypothetical protein
MLNYHPMGDVYHCIFRLLLLVNASNRHDIEWERLRLMDFYFLFPHFLSHMSVPKEYRSFKKIFADIPKPYEETMAPARLYFQLGLIQENAIRSLIAKQYFDRETFLMASTVRKIVEFPEPIKTIVTNDPRISTSWFQPFLTLFLNTSLTGQSGLKLRTGIMEHRYDAT